MPQAKATPQSSLTRFLPAFARLIFAFMFAKYAILQQFTTTGVDFPKHYYAAQAILRGESPYVGDFYLSFNYPLFTAWIYAWLAPFTLSRAEFLWDLCNTLYVVASLGLIIVYYRPTDGGEGATSRSLSPGLRKWIVAHWSAVCAFAVAIYAPIFLEIRDGNIEPLNLLLVVAFGAALMRGREGVAGVLFAALCLVKIIPVFFIPALFLGGKRKTIGVCAIFVGVYGLMLLVTGLWREDFYLLTHVLPNIGFHYRGLSNSLVAIAGQHFFPSVMESKAMFDWTTKGIAAAIGGAYIAVVWMSARCRTLSWRAGLALASLTIVLMSPLLEYNHIIWAIPAYLFLLVDAAEGSVSRRFFVASFGLWIGVFACRYWCDLSSNTGFPPLHVSTLLLAVLWAVTAGGMLSAVGRREQRPQPRGWEQR